MYEEITAKEYRQLKRNKKKYHNRRQTYNGVHYDSKLEAHTAENLDWLVKAGDVIEWERQVRIEFNLMEFQPSEWALLGRCRQTLGEARRHARHRRRLPVGCLE